MKALSQQIRVPRSDGWALLTMTAAEVMTTRPVVVSERDSLAFAWELLVRGRFHHLPVMRGNRCVGVLDDRMLVRCAVPGSLSRVRRLVGDLLPGRVPSVAPEAQLPSVARRFREEHVDALPVVDDGGHLLGLVTSTDLVTALGNCGGVI